jgi:glycosyltransferase involved in cell wall biosynthesis
MSSRIKLSYIITTKNKLPYLKDRLEKLIAIRKTDEEILIADGASSDGTKEYLKGLKKSGKIDSFVSEPDFGESHALNKLMLAANGPLIKIISDDDVFHYPTIEICKDFMLAHSEIDFVSTNGGFKNQDTDSNVRTLDSIQAYKRWLHNQTPFSFCGLGYIVRKSALPVTGLWNISFRRADAEFTLRLTAGKARIAWYTGYSFVNISNPQSVSLVFMKKIKAETDRLNSFYLGILPDPYLIERLKVLRNKIRSVLTKSKEGVVYSFESRWPSLSTRAEEWLEDKNTESQGEFLWEKNQ